MNRGRWPKISGKLSSKRYVDSFLLVWFPAYPLHMSRGLRHHLEQSSTRGMACWVQEKRKREAGQAKSSKNYVEEEKRIARNFGMYSGFDV